MVRLGIHRKCWSEFLCLGGYLAPPRQVGGYAPRNALGRHPSADPRRWRPAGGPVAGAQLDIIASDLRVIYHTCHMRLSRRLLAVVLLNIQASFTVFSNMLVGVRLWRSTK
jgi:hypothetical protein